MKLEPAQIQVRFADIDAMGHVNNAVYLSYFETARMHYFGHMLGTKWDWNKDGIILLKNEVEYLKSVRLHDMVEIEVYLESIGNKSFTLGYNLTVEGVTFCKGLSTLVGFDNDERKTIEIPKLMREQLMKLERNSN